MKKIDRRIIIVSAFIFIVGLAFGIMKFLIAQKEEAPARRDNDTRRYVQTTLVTYGTVESSVQAMGRLRSLSSVDIVAEASGKINPGDISLKKGAAFSKGDLLFTIYKDEAELDLQGKKSRFMHTLANLLPDIRIDYPAYEKSFIDFFNAVNIYDDLPPMPEINNEKLKVFMASRNVLDEYYGIRRDELRLKRHSIYAPFNGTYSDVYLEAGAYINTGGRVAHAIQTDVLELEVPVKRSDAVWINNGDDVLVMRPGDKSEFRGEVIRKGSFIDDATQSQAIFIR
ncbi:MAG: HlyD family efflux transporter periplasmic adaptor subunit, partial [Bacteroidales bacterium]|nr:HlyD family efflux transporter periplasmic adaptor subunit [Bacteroidales bacterium]